MARLRQNDLCTVMTITIVVVGCLVVTDAIHPSRVETPDKQINVFLLGRAGAGKSTIGNAFVDALMDWKSTDFTLETPQEWKRERGPHSSWEQCDCTECHSECPQFDVSGSTQSCTNNVSASTVVWAELSRAHMLADDLPSDSEADHQVTRIRLFDTPGMPDTNPDSMSEYYDKIVYQMAQVGKVDAVVWVQSDGRVNAADRGLRVLLKQFNIFPTKVLLVNGKGHYRKSDTDTKGNRKRRHAQPDKESYRNKLEADWAFENEVGVGWHGQMFVSVDEDDLDESVMPNLISYILAASAGRASKYVADPNKLRTLQELWEHLETEFLEFTSDQQFSERLVREARLRLSQINFELKFYNEFESSAARTGAFVEKRFGLLGHFLSHYGARIFRSWFDNANQLRAARESVQADIRNIEHGNLEGIKYVQERAGEIRDLCALLAKPDCPNVGAFVRDPLKQLQIEDW